MYWTLALCEGAFFTGMILSGAIVGKRKIKRPGVAFIWGIVILGLTIAAMAFSRSVWLFAFWNFAAGIGVPLAHIPTQTYIQTTVPDHYRGRVNSLLTWREWGFNRWRLDWAAFCWQVSVQKRCCSGWGWEWQSPRPPGLRTNTFRRATLPDPS